MCDKASLKILFFGFNFVLWIAGCALLAVGIWMRVDYTIVNYLHVVNFHSSDPLLDHASLLFLVIGGLTFLVGFLGCCGIMRSSQPLLFAYAVILTLLLLAEITASVLAVLYRKEVTAHLHNSMRDQLQEDYMNKNNSITVAWDNLMIKSQCCGADGPHDFETSAWLVNGSHGVGMAVPSSCCVMNLDQVPENPDLCQADAKSNVTTSTALHVKGCFPVLEAWFQAHSWAFVGVGFGVVVVQLAGIILAIRLRNYMARRQSRK